MARRAARSPLRPEMDAACGAVRRVMPRTSRATARFLDAPGTCRAVPFSATSGRQFDVWPERAIDGAGFPTRMLLGLGCLAGLVIDRGIERLRAPDPADGDIQETDDATSRIWPDQGFGLAITRTGTGRLDLDILHRTSRLADRLVSGTVRTLRLRLCGLDDDEASALTDSALSGHAAGLSPRESLTRLREYRRTLAMGRTEAASSSPRVVALRTHSIPA